MNKKIGIINYGSGNYFSVLNAINFLGYEKTIFIYLIFFIFFQYK